MTATTDATTVASTPPPMSSRPVITPAGFARRARTPLLLALLVVVTGVMLALLGASPGASLDPQSPAKGGSEALATLLRARGVTVTRTDLLPVSADAVTVLVPDLTRLGEADLARLSALARTTDVVAAVDGSSGAGAVTEGSGLVTVRARDPACGLAAAVTAGPAEMGGIAFPTDGAPPSGLRVDARCYPAGGRPTLVRYVAPGGSLTVAGSATFLRNDHLAKEGNAALALGLLDAHPDVLWVLPRPGAAGAGGTVPLTDLLPRGLLFGAGELLVVVALLALWRGRRLGPVVREPLPVVVHASETVRGQARLYRSAHARDRAALAMRQACRARLARGLGLATATAPPALVAAVAVSSGRAAGTVASLLYGDDHVVDDDALTRLVDDLDQLEREVRL